MGTAIKYHVPVVARYSVKHI